jgi:hypothetical protein
MRGASGVMRRAVSCIAVSATAPTSPLPNALKKDIQFTPAREINFERRAASHRRKSAHRRLVSMRYNICLPEM